jgi:uncharacterized delta-60 repeat protein
MKILSAWIVLSLGLFGATSAFAAAGSLDSKFGNGGIVDTDFGPNNNNFSFSDAALALNGDIVVAGSVSFLDGQQEEGVIVCYLPTGALDTSFANGGILALPAPTSYFLGSSYTGSITVQSTGKILALFGATNDTGTEFETVLLRLNINGQPDTTFGTGGQVTINFPTPATFAASPSLVLAQPDGKILLAGSATPPFRSKLSPETVLARYLSNGALDTSFGTGGFSEVVAISTPSALALLSGDGILAVNQTAQIAQFTPAGALLKAQSGGTIIATKASGIVTFQPNGSYLFAGTGQGPGGRRDLDAKISRFLLSGAVDPSFASPVISFGPDGAVVQSDPAGIGADSLGRITIGGIYANGGSGFFGLARVNTTGTVDTTFGTGGSLTTRVALEGSVFAILIQPDNKILAIGEVQVSKDTSDTMEDLALVRYLAQ